LGSATIAAANGLALARKALDSVITAVLAPSRLVADRMARFMRAIRELIANTAES
jgi:hypothetical protein